MKQHIYILILIISLLSISSKTYSQVDISVRNINRGIELCDEGKHHIGLFYLSIGLRNEELPDSLRNIGELYRQCSYIITDKEKVSNDILENVLPNIKEPLYVSIYAYLHLGQYYIQREQFNKANSYLNKCLNECEKNGRKDSIEYIWCLTDMARIMTKQGNYNATNSLHKQIYTLLKIEGNNIYKENLMYLLFAYYDNNYMNLHNYNEALNIAKENTTITYDLYGNISQKYIQTLIDQSYAYSALSQYKSVIELSDSICILQEKLTGKNNPNYYIALRNKVYAYSEIEDYNNALKHSNELLQLTENTEYWLDNASYNVSINHNLGKYDDAIKRQKEIVNLYKKENRNSYKYIQSLYNLRTIYDDISGYKKEITELDEYILSLDITRTMTKEELLSLFMIKSRIYQNRSYLEYSSYIKTKINELDSILGLDIYYQSFKCFLLDIIYPNYNDAIDYVESHLSLLKDRQMYKSKYGIQALNELAELYAKNKELLKAISINEQTLSINQELYGKQSSSYIEDLDFLSTRYLTIGNIEKYVELQNQMFNIIKEHYGENSHLYIAKRANPINAYFTPEKSLKELLSILDNNINKNLPSHIFLCTSIAYFQQNDYKNAIKYADLKLKKSVSSQDSIWGLTLKIAALKQLNKWDEVEECSHLEFSIANNKKDLEQQISCMEDLALISFKKGDFLKAQTLIKEITLNKWNDLTRTLSLLPEKERAQYWTSMTNAHYKYLPNYISNEDYKKEHEFVTFILDNQLRQKGLLLNYSLAFKEANSIEKDSIYKDKFQLYQSLKRNIEKLSDSDFQLMNKIENELVNQTNIKFDETSCLDIKKKLNSNDLVLEFIDYPLLGKRIYKENENKYVVILLKHDWNHPIMISLPIDSVSISQNNIDYSQIWKPIEEYIKPGDNIYFSASGILHQIPIESLPIGDGKIMSDVYNMHRLSSTRELVKEKKEMKYTKAALYGGLNYDMTDSELLAENQTYSKNATEEYFVSRGLLEDSIRGYKWDKLSNTLQEVDYISDLMKKNQITTQTYKGNKGNEESFKALSGHEYNIIHLATHGFFYPDEEAKEKDYFKSMLLNDHYQKYNEVDMSMWRSGLVLSGGNRAWKGDTIPDTVEDGILKAQEIGDLDLRGADLVVLSACNTGQGEVTGEGVFGLQRAFKMAGAQTIVMSLTPVDDQTTMVMMNKFYTNQFSGQSKHNAFYNAQRYIRSIKPDPKYWMGWIMLD